VCINTPSPRGRFPAARAQCQARGFTDRRNTRGALRHRRQQGISVLALCRRQGGPPVCNTASTLWTPTHDPRRRSPHSSAGWQEGLRRRRRSKPDYTFVQHQQVFSTNACPSGPTRRSNPAHRVESSSKTPQTTCCIGCCHSRHFRHLHSDLSTFGNPGNSDRVSAAVLSRTVFCHLCASAIHDTSPAFKFLHWLFLSYLYCHHRLLGLEIPLYQPCHAACGCRRTLGDGSIT
jgi:hypothetical protein